LLILACWAVPASLQAQDSLNNPSWILFEQGQRAYREGDFGGALRLFQQAAEKEAVYPEAEFWIGIVYEKEGQPELAERQYKKALEMSRALYVPEDRYTILYRLSDIYKTTGRFKDYEDTLLMILDLEMTADPGRIRNEHAWCSTMTEQGFDKLLYLYRLKLTYSYRAASELGVYYYKKKDYRASFLKNLMTVMTGYTVTVETILRRDPDFEFPATRQDLMALDEDWYYRSLETPERPFSGALYLLDRSAGDPSIAAYLSDSGFYQSFYYLGMSLYALGHKEISREVFDVLRNVDTAGVWKNRARDQYVNPRIDSSEIIY
jgi:tetratricopeptide (TPR) repeat protein